MQTIGYIYTHIHLKNLHNLNQGLFQWPPEKVELLSSPQS